MNHATFADFESAARAEGFDEVLERVWAPGQVLETHSHPFEVRAQVVQGEVQLTCGEQTRQLRAGEGFELAHGVPHAEHYGAQGATFWVARRHQPG